MNCCGIFSWSKKNFDASYLSADPSYLRLDDVRDATWVGRICRNHGCDLGAEIGAG